MNGFKIKTISSVSVILVISLFTQASLVEAQAQNLFPATLELSSLDGTNGFVINGVGDRQWGSDGNGSDHGGGELWRWRINHRCPGIGEYR